MTARVRKKEKMAGNVGEASASLQNEKTYDLVCLGFYNEDSMCYLNVTINSLLTMEVTRRAFMNLPDPDSPNYRIPDDSLTGMINFFFLHRRRPKIPNYHPHARTVELFNRIEKKIRSDFPMPGMFVGNGGSSEIALYFVLHKLREEGYVKGLEEDVWGDGSFPWKTCFSIIID